MKQTHLPKETPPQELLLTLLRYEAETGSLFWLPRSVEYFNGPAAERLCRSWNERFAGKEAFGKVNPKGYLRGCVLRNAYPAHRLIYKMMTGRDPQFIDHINGNKSDNRWENLRSVSVLENSRNVPRPKRNKSGRIGVCWATREAKWKAFIFECGVQRNLGTFNTFEDAEAARKQAELAIGYHPNHGRELRDEMRLRLPYA